MSGAEAIPFSVEVPLDEKTRLHIRSVRPEDKTLIREGLAQFSSQSLYHRFFTPVIEFSEQRLRYLTEVDHHDHCAIGAIDVTDATPQGVGIARYIRLDAEPQVAKAAVAIIDAYQGKGIGSLLMAALSRLAAANGIEIFRGYLLKNNRRFIRNLIGLGALNQRVSAGVVEIDLPVYDDVEELPDTPEAKTARRAWTRL